MKKTLTGCPNKNKRTLFTPGANHCFIKIPEPLSCRQRFATIIRTHQLTKVVFLNNHTNSKQVGRKVEGQMGGILGKPKKF